MGTKLKTLGLGAVLLLGLYGGGSYYLGARAEQQVRDIVEQAQAQSQGQLVVSGMDTEAGVFQSTGQLIVRLPQLRVHHDQPVEFAIDYQIDHALHWAQVATFDWAVVPQAPLADQMADIYRQVPRLTGQGVIDWSGRGTSSIGFPGVDDAALDGQTLTMAPVNGELVLANNAFDLQLNVPALSLQTESLIPGKRPTRQTLTIRELAYEARSTDTRSGQAQLALTAKRAQWLHSQRLPAEVTDYRWEIDIGVSQGVLSLGTRQTAASVIAMGGAVDNVDVGLGLQGLHRDDVVRLTDWLDAFDGEFTDMTETQASEVQDLLLQMLARGVTLSVPAIKGDLRLVGGAEAQTVGVEGFRLSAQVFDTVSGTGSVTTELQSLRVPPLLQSVMPDIRGLKLDISNQLVDGRTDLKIQHALARFQQQDRTIQDVKLDFQLAGFTPDQLGAIGEILQDINGDLGRLSLADQRQLRTILHDAALHGLSLAVPVAQATMDVHPDGRDTFKLEGFSVQTKLDDLATGAGRANLALDALTAQGPQMTRLPQIERIRLNVDNRVIDNKIDYEVNLSVQSLQNPEIQLGDADVSMTVSGLIATDMQRLSMLLESMQAGLTPREQGELAQIARRALQTGFKWEIPRLDFNLDAARVNGRAVVSLAGLGAAPLVTFNVARLGQLDATVDIQGTSPALDGLLAQGQAAGFLVSQGQDTQGHVTFKDGQLRVNGVALPVNDYVLVTNAMVQGALARSLPEPQAPAPARPRRQPD